MNFEHFTVVVVILTAWLWTPPAVAGSARQALIGAPVYAADEVEVGRVADVSTTGSQIDALRVRTGAQLGLGERFVVIPQPAFMIKGRRVILPDLRKEDLDLFPDASGPALRSEDEER